MVFDDKTNELNIKTYPNGVDRHIYLKSELADALETVKTVYENEVRNISYNNLCKIAINFLIESLDDLTDVDAIELLKNQHKEVILL